MPSTTPQRPATHPPAADTSPGREEALKVAGAKAAQQRAALAAAKERRAIRRVRREEAADAAPMTPPRRGAGRAALLDASVESPASSLGSPTSSPEGAQALEPEADVQPAAEPMVADAGGGAWARICCCCFGQRRRPEYEPAQATDDDSVEIEATGEQQELLGARVEARTHAIPPYILIYTHC